MSKREQILQLLEEYPELIRNVSILRFELQRPPAISPEEMIDSMNFVRGSGEGHVAGAISNKTMYIALNYREHAERINQERLDEIAGRLVPMERSIERLQHYVSLLDKRMAQVIRAYYFEHQAWDDIASQLGLSVRSVQKLKNAAIDKLAEMYEFAEGKI